MYLLIAVGVVCVLLMLVGLWLSSSAFADTLLAPFQRVQAKEDRHQERELEALLRGDESEVQEVRKNR